MLTILWQEDYYVVLKDAVVVEYFTTLEAATLAIETIKYMSQEAA